MFASGSGSGEDGLKDTLRNVEATGEFVCNLATWENREQMNESSASVPKDVNEMELTGLTSKPGRLVDVPWVEEAPVHLECKHIKSVDLPNWGNNERYVVVFGEVIGIHIQDELITDEGLVDVGRMRPLGRLGYNDYTEVDSNSIFTMVRPDWSLKDANPFNMYPPVFLASIFSIFSLDLISLLLSKAQRRLLSAHSLQ